MVEIEVEQLAMELGDRPCPCYRWDTNEPCRWHEPEAWRERTLSQSLHASQEGTS